jgi:hypothetical protein
MAERIIDEVKAVAASKGQEGQHAMPAGMASVLGDLTSQAPEMVSLDLTGEHNEYHLRLSLGMAKELLQKLDGLGL